MTEHETTNVVAVERARLLPQLTPSISRVNE